MTKIITQTPVPMPRVMKFRGDYYTKRMKLPPEERRTRSASCLNVLNEVLVSVESSESSQHFPPFTPNLY